MIFPSVSISKPGMELSFGLRGPMPDRNKRFPALLAWGYAPSGFDASPVLIMPGIMRLFQLLKILTEVRQNIKAIPVTSFFSVFIYCQEITCRRIFVITYLQSRLVSFFEQNGSLCWAIYRVTWVIESFFE